MAVERERDAVPRVLDVTVTYEWEGETYEVQMDAAETTAVFLDTDAARAFTEEIANREWNPREIEPDRVGSFACYAVRRVAASPRPARKIAGEERKGDTVALKSCVCVKCKDCSVWCLPC